MNLNELIKLNKLDCPCKKAHQSSLDDVVIGSSVINKIPELIRRYNARRPFILSDLTTFEIAGKRVCDMLTQNEIEFTSYALPSKTPKPDEKSVGSAVLHYDSACDIIIGVGSGVINDIGKILAATAQKPYIIVATAPSVDGYASSTSSMDRDGLKISVNSKMPSVIVGDIEILKNAPKRMLLAGLGDILAKYTSLCEWRIGNIVTGEYYCEYVASLVRYSAKSCIDNAKGLLTRDGEAVRAVFEALIVSGLAMSFAGVSRPASGVEHYYSHLFDMRSLEFGTKADLHGIQCAYGFLSASRVYERLKNITPNKEKAKSFAKDFDVDEWNKTLRKHWGHAAEPMIALGVKDGRYDLAEHEKRLDVIIERWSDIMRAAEEELLPLSTVQDLFSELELPNVPKELNIESELLKITFKATKDIRAKYILSTLLWDIGELDNPELLEVL